MQKINLYDKIISPLLTEKSTNLSEQNKIIFKVPSQANKTNLKTNIEKIFKVNVVKINIINKKNRIKNTRGKKVKISGPFSADTIFLKNNRKKFDVIVGMFHDQVLAPMKTIFGFDAINSNSILKTGLIAKKYIFNNKNLLYFYFSLLPLCLFQK